MNVERTAAGTAESWCADKPLIGIVSLDDTPESGERIEVIADDLPGGHAAYWVSEPQRVWVARGEKGSLAGLQIDSADGSVTVIRFEPPVEGMPFGFKFA